MAKRYGKPDAENPEWTAEDFRQARRAGDVLPADVFRDAPTRRARGPQRAPTKQLVSLRISQETIAAYRKTGRGWQSRIDEDLAKSARRRAKHASLPV